MVTLPPQTVPRPGLSTVYDPANAEGDEFANSGDEFIRIKNDDDSEHTATILTTAVRDGLAIADRVVAVPAGEERTIGPFQTEIYNDDYGMVQVTYDGVTDVTIAVVKHTLYPRAPSTGGPTVYVPDDYPTINAALGHPGQYYVIKVRPGTYVENISLAKSVTIESESGDPTDTIIDGGQHATKATVEIMDGGEGTAGACRLIGFTVTNGRGHDITGTKYGGGIYCDRAGGITLKNNDIRDNKADFGGGVFFEQANAPISNPVMVGNKIHNNDATGKGGGICGQNCSLALRIEDNDIYNNFAGDDGGGIALWGYASDFRTMTIIKNRIYINMAFNDGGGVYINDTSHHEWLLEKNVIAYNRAKYGAGVHCVVDLIAEGDIPVHFEKCDIFNNTADLHGGGIYTRTEDALIRNCFIYKNVAGFDGEGKGGGVYTKSDFMGFINSTFYQNTSDDGQGIFIDHDTPANAYIQIVNCILWNDGTGTQDDEIADIGSIPALNLTIVYSDIQGWVGGAGNIDADPEFLGVGANNYHIDGESPCVDAGANQGYWNLPPDDYDYEIRPNPATPDYDTGADEVNPTE